MTKPTWPTLEGRLKNPLKTNEEALEQLKKIYPDAKLPSDEERAAFEKETSIGG
jgi:hypothetical protein